MTDRIHRDDIVIIVYIYRSTIDNTRDPGVIEHQHPSHVKHGRIGVRNSQIFFVFVFYDYIFNTRDMCGQRAFQFRIVLRGHDKIKPDRYRYPSRSLKQIRIRYFTFVFTVLDRFEFFPADIVFQKIIHVCLRRPHAAAFPPPAHVSGSATKFLLLLF